MPARTAARRPLTPERVVAAAMKVADREGVTAVTMRRLADALQVHPTSLYNHLPSKEGILDAAQSGDKESGARQLARAMKKQRTRNKVTTLLNTSRSQQSS